MKNYNGWRNRETWLVNLHFEINSKDDLEYAKNHIEGMEDKLRDEMPFISDFIDLSLIDWDELESHIEDEDEDED